MTTTSIRSLAAAALLLAATPPSASSRARADDLLARSRATYAALRSYADSGTVELEYGPVGATLRERHRFVTYYREPRSFYFAFVKQQQADRFVVWSDAQAFHTWWQTTGIETTYPKGQGIAAFTTGESPTKRSLMQIAPLLFAKAKLVGTLTEFGDASEVGMESVGGRPCHKLVGVARTVYPVTQHVVNVRRTTVWIDAQTFLVRKVFEDTPRGVPAGTVSRTTTTFEPHANPVLADSLFRFTPPETNQGD